MADPIIISIEFEQPEPVLASVEKAAATMPTCTISWQITGDPGDEILNNVVVTDTLPITLKTSVMAFQKSMSLFCSAKTNTVDPCLNTYCSGELLTCPQATCLLFKYIWGRAKSPVSRYIFVPRMSRFFTGGLFLLIRIVYKPHPSQDFGPRNLPVTVSPVSQLLQQTFPLLSQP